MSERSDAECFSYKVVPECVRFSSLTAQAPLMPEVSLHIFNKKIVIKARQMWTNHGCFALKNVTITAL